MNNMMQIYELFDRKIKILKKILSVTKAQKFEVSTDDNTIEKISSYLSMRDTFFRKLENVEKKIKSLTQNNNYRQFKQYHKEVEELELECRKIISEIIFLDNKNNIVFNKIYSIIKNNIKAIQNGKQINTGYNSYVSFSSHFDSQK